MDNFLGNWLVLGLIAASFWGIYVVILKYAVNPAYQGTPWPIAMFGLSLGVLLVSAVLFVVNGVKANGFGFTSAGFMVSAIAGVFWAVGISVVLIGLSHPGVDASRLVVVYNLNTLVAVLAAVLLLSELPVAGKRVEVVIGALLVILGAYLVSS